MDPEELKRRTRENDEDNRRYDAERLERHGDMPRGDAERAADRILNSSLDVQLTPRQIGRLLGLIALDRSAYLNEPEELAQLGEISDRLTQAVAQIGARP